MCLRVGEEGPRNRERPDDRILHCSMQCGEVEQCATRARASGRDLDEILEADDRRPPAAPPRRDAGCTGATDMKARIKWTEGVSFVAETGSGHALVIDGASEAGGRNLGPRPMELVLAGAAACSAFDVVWILKKARQPVTDCVVEAHADRAAVEPKVFTGIHLTFRVAGRGLDPRQVEKAVKLSKEKYCSATIMLAKTAEITSRIEIVEGDRVPIEPAGIGAG